MPVIRTCISTFLSYKLLPDFLGMIYGGKDPQQQTYAPTVLPYKSGGPNYRTEEMIKHQWTGWSEATLTHTMPFHFKK